MDILSAEKTKKYIRAATWLLRKKLGETATTDNVHSDMANCGNEAFAVITQLLNIAADNIKEPYQEKTVRELGELVLWILYKDTAYRDVVFWLMYQMGNKEIQRMVLPYVKNPEDWYVNVWHDTKANTKKKRERGDLPKNHKSFDETIFIPAIQEQRLKKYKQKK